LYSHLCIYVSIQLPIYTEYIWTGCKLRLREIRGAPEDDHRMYSDIHSEAEIDRVWRCLGDRHRASLEMHLEAVIERSWRYTWRPWSSELRDALRGHDRVSLEMYLQAIIERDWRSSRSGGGQSGGGQSGGGQSGGGQSGGGWWEEGQVLRLYSSVNWLTTMGMWLGDFTFEALMESWLVAVDL